MNRPEHEIDAYLEGTLNEAQARELEAWINADPANAAEFLHLVRTHQMLGIVGNEQRLSRQVAAVKPDQLDPVTLASLAEMEAAAEPLTLYTADRSSAFGSSRKQQTRRDLSLSQALDDLRWATGKFATRLIQSKPVITGTLAAILILGLYLFVPFGSSDPAPPQEIANNTPSEPGRAGPDTTLAVATLTATHNAQWGDTLAQRALAQGSALRSGQRLTLTQGFAEITTNDGAVVILEAPATVELLNNNAIHLHSGKLVGICETESSKGFLVHTTQMDVNDLGTKFGVVCDEHLARTTVIEGEIAISAVGAASSEPATHLIAGQSAQVKASTKRVTQVESISDRFVYDMRAATEAVVTTGRIRYEPSIPHDLRVGVEEDVAVRLFAERSSVPIDDALTIDLTEPGHYIVSEQWDELRPGPALIDSYYIHYDFPSNANGIPSETVTIRFDRPILGVIASAQRLSQTHALLGIPGVRYADQSNWLLHNNDGTSEDHSGLDTSGDPERCDVVTLSEDRRSITFKLGAAVAVDQARILVESAPKQRLQSISSP